MAKNKYTTSKVMLTCASFLAFGSISALVSIRGPFGNTAQAQTQPASAQRATFQDDRGERFKIDDDGRVVIDNGSGRFSVSSNGPVARSRGS